MTNHFTPQLASAVDGDGLPSTVPVDQVYDLSTLDAIRAGDVVPVTTQSAVGDTWDPASLLRYLGV